MKIILALALLASLAACGGGGPNEPGIDPAERTAREAELFCADHGRVFIMAQHGLFDPAVPEQEIRVRCVDGTEIIMVVLKATGERVQ